MRTKELIEMLRKEDPSEECYIRWEGVPISAALETKGPFYFFDENGKMHITNNGYRVDIKTKGAYDFIKEDLAQWYEKLDRTNPIEDDRDMLMEKLKSFFIVETSEVTKKWFNEDIEKQFSEWIKNYKK